VCPLAALGGGAFVQTRPSVVERKRPMGRAMELDSPLVWAGRACRRTLIAGCPLVKAALEFAGT